MDQEPSPEAPPRRTIPAVPAGVWAAVAVAAALIASYLPSIRNLIQTWMSEPNYSHGFLVAPISALILWFRRKDLARVTIRPNILGWAGVLAIVAWRVWLYEENEMWMEQATIPALVACLVLAFGGWGLLRWAAPAILFLLVLLPLPPRINIVAAGPLQTMATMASTAILTMTGLPVLYEGHIIYVGSQPLEVARACSGLSMLMSFAALVPIALLVNILRIVATGWAYHALGYDFGEKVMHDLAGWLMMPTALAFVVLELKLLSWLIIPQEVRDEAVVFLPQAMPRISRPAKGKKPGPAIDGPGIGE